jgi:hypothetical protein
MWITLVDIYVEKLLKCGKHRFSKSYPQSEAMYVEKLPLIHIFIHSFFHTLQKNFYRIKQLKSFCTKQMHSTITTNRGKDGGRK